MKPVNVAPILAEDSLFRIVAGTAQSQVGILVLGPGEKTGGPRSRRRAHHRSRRPPRTPLHRQRTPPHAEYLRPSRVLDCSAAAVCPAGC